MKNGKRLIKFLLLIALVLIGFLIFSFYRDQNLQGLLDEDGASEIDTERIENAIKKLSLEETKSEVLTHVKTDKKVLALSFQGLSDEETTQSVLELLEDSNTKAEFFVSGNLAIENSNVVRKLARKGQTLGSNTLFGEEELDKLPAEDLVDDFVRTNLIFKGLIKKEPELLLANRTKYTKELLRAAYVSGHPYVVKPSQYLSYQSFKDEQETKNYIKNLEKGALLTIKMDGVLEADEYKQSKTTEKPAIDKKPGTKEQEENPLDDLSPEERLLKIVEWLLKAIDKEGYEVVPIEELATYKKKESTKNNDTEKAERQVEVNPVQESSKPTKVFYTKKEKKKDAKKEKEIVDKKEEEKIKKETLEQLRKDNQGQKAKVYETIHTTEKALSYTFYGIENKKVLTGVLENMKRLDAKATFFVSKKDLLNHSEEIKKISEQGHELGIALLEGTDKDFMSTLHTILLMQEALEKLTGQVPDFVRYPYNLQVSDEILEAISAGNARLIWEDLAVASSEIGPNGNLSQIMSTIFRPDNRVAQRGYIIYYRMDYYKDSALIPAAMLEIKKEKIDTIAFPNEPNSEYALKTVGSVLAGEKVYRYPVAEEDILSELRNKIYPGQLAAYSEAEKLEQVKKRYIGNPNVSNLNTLPGFTEEEIEEIDTTGIFTTEPVIFLTFDDWSSDRPINQLLSVLEKHKVKAGFYIRTNYMQNNPNILRAIAEAGHDVGNHSDEHLPLARSESGEEMNEDDVTSKYLSLTESELKERQADLLLAHNKLLSVVGDVQIDNRPALISVFRPPTLAMSKGGVEAVLDMGYQYVVSGDFSTHDYEDSDPEYLANKLIHGMTTSGGTKMQLQNGSVLVMHMSDHANVSGSKQNVTAAALDIAIPKLKERGYRFGRIGDYLK